MCGLAGFYTISKKIKTENGSDILNDMCDSIISRGPDAFGYWIDQEDSVFLGHRRLSILELSDAGKQPMTSANKKFVIIFNGEIYNHLLIRQEIEKQIGTINWRGLSDTETILAGFELWGVEITIQKLIGMFAFAVWNTEEKSFTLGRDRVGEKPLYYGWLSDNESKNILVFGSQLKSIRKHPAFNSEIDRNALSLYFRHNYIPAPHSIYKGIYKLEPGTLFIVSDSSIDGKIIKYWSAENIAKEGVLNPFEGTLSDAVTELDSLLNNAVKLQMISDVPLGAFLSGGVDSSTIVALMQSNSSKAVKTFSIGFTDEMYNEAKYAKQVAQHIGTEHTEMYVTPQQAMNVIQELPEIYDEPFSDSSQIPTYLVSKLAKSQVTVSLSGDAGDELFCGYNRYSFTKKLWNYLNYLPIGVRNGLAYTLSSVSPDKWNNLFISLPFVNNHRNIGDKIHKASGILTSRTIDDLYLGLISHWSSPCDLVINSVEPSRIYESYSSLFNVLDDVQKMMFLDTITYLPDDILVKVDRAAMAVSLETRVPFLDHRVVEFAWSLPQKYKINNGVSKLVLREVLYNYVPKNMIERPKMGFGVPLGDWLRGPLKPWAEELISEDKIRKEGLLNYDLIKDKWDDHMSSKRNWAYQIWDVLMFQAWFENQKKN